MRIPLSLDPRVIDRHRARDKASGAVISDAAIDAVSAAMKSAHELAHQIAAASASIMADATVTPEANAVRLKKTTMQLAERATKALDEARARALAEIKTIDRSMVIEAPKDAAEMRAVLRTMTSKQRSKALADDAFAASALSAHPLLSGLGDAERAMMLSRYQRERYPEQSDRRTRITRALDDLERGGSALVSLVTSITDQPAVQRAEAAAHRASQAVSGAAAQ